MTTLRRLRNLSWSDWTILATSLVMLPAAAVGLRVFAFARVRAMFEHPPVPPAAGADDFDRARATARMVAAAAHYSIYKATCLPQSLVLRWQLARQGIESDLHFGVRREGEGIGAHSWVEHRGVPLIDSPAVRERFAEFRGAR